MGQEWSTKVHWKFRCLVFVVNPFWKVANSWNDEKKHVHVIILLSRIEQVRLDSLRGVSHKQRWMGVNREQICAHLWLVNSVAKCKQIDQMEMAGRCGRSYLYVVHQPIQDHWIVPSHILIASLCALATIRTISLTLLTLILHKKGYNSDWIKQKHILKRVDETSEEFQSISSEWQPRRTLMSSQWVSEWVGNDIDYTHPSGRPWKHSL